MRAKTINEVQEFERGKDPKEALDIGIKDYDDYIKRYFEKQGEDPQDFWETLWDVHVNQAGPAALWDDMLEILKHTPIEYQIEWAQDKLGAYEHGKEMPY